MKKLLLSLFAVLVVSLSLAASANAGCCPSRDTVSSFTQLNTSSWTPLPNGTNRYAWQTYGTLAFEWNGSVPGKDTSVRVVRCNGDVVPNTYVRIPANKHGYTLIWYPTGGPNSCFRVQGRMPDSEGNMADAHFYDFTWDYGF